MKDSDPLFNSFKVLHTYEDGTLKVFYSSGRVGLYKPSCGKPVDNPNVKDIELKILVKVDGKVYSFLSAGGIPIAMEEADAKWFTISGSTHGELIYKVLINSAMICARALGTAAQYYFLSCIMPIRAIFDPSVKVKND